jgi:hypothetical protein
MGNQHASRQPRFQKFAVFSIFVLHNISLMVLFFGNYLLSVDEDIQMTIWSTRALIILLVKMVILFEIFMVARSFYFVKESNHG